MDESNRDVFFRIWQELSSSYRWRLVSDVEAWIGTLMREVADHQTSLTEATIRALLKRHYSRLLYDGIIRREEQAAQELWVLFVRLGQRDYPVDQVSDLAQEAVFRCLQKIDQVREPDWFVSWAMKVFRTVCRDLRPKPEASLDVIQDESGSEPSDPQDVLANVEALIINAELRTWIQRLVPNPTGRVALLRWMLFYEKPKETARILGEPEHKVRIEKSRALQRLRKDATFVAFLQSLTSEEPLL